VEEHRIATTGGPDGDRTREDFHAVARKGMLKRNRGTDPAAVIPYPLPR